MTDREFLLQTPLTKRLAKKAVLQQPPKYKTIKQWEPSKETRQKKTSERKRTEQSEFSFPSMGRLVDMAHPEPGLF
jgi:hypothetical protein